MARIRQSSWLLDNEGNGHALKQVKLQMQGQLFVNVVDVWHIHLQTIIAIVLADVMSPKGVWAGTS